MPLAFDSISHGRVAFGFFNIDCDMLLLERYFFFADLFCDELSRLAEVAEPAAVELSWPVYLIADPLDVGDLMGAIHGVRHTGFIGATYRRFPFPEHEDGFKQQPDGARNRDVFVELIEPFAELIDLRVAAGSDAGEVTFGELRFTRAVFHELVHYVWRGGYPRWRDEVRPEYVARMRQAIEGSRHWLFAGIGFQG